MSTDLGTRLQELAGDTAMTPGRPEEPWQRGRSWQRISVGTVKPQARDALARLRQALPDLTDEPTQPVQPSSR